MDKKESLIQNIVSFRNFKIGVLFSVLVQPFEVIRTSSIIKQQQNIKENINLTGMFEIIKRIKKEEGIKGFFRGSTLSIAKTTLGLGLFFTNLENFNFMTQGLMPLHYFSNVQSLFTQNMINFLNASIAKLVSTILVSPLNVLKTRFEVCGNHQYSGIREGLTQIIQKEGFKGFYRGLATTLLRDVPFSGIQYSTYKFWTNLYQFVSNKNPQDNKVIIASTGAFSSIFAIILTYPFDNLRVRYQFETGQSKSLSLLSREIYQNEGIQGFYKGYLPKVIKKAVTGSVIWSLYELIIVKNQNNN